MATAGGAGEVSVLISGAAAVDAAPGGELQHREQTLNSFVRVVAFGEWAGNAFGALAFLWATGVLLGGFCSDLEPLDFWSAMVIIFIEAFRYVLLIILRLLFFPIICCHYLLPSRRPIIHKRMHDRHAK
jgi:hypothetical protein